MIEGKERDGKGGNKISKGKKKGGCEIKGNRKES